MAWEKQQFQFALSEMMFTRQRREQTEKTQTGSGSSSISGAASIPPANCQWGHFWQFSTTPVVWKCCTCDSPLLLSGLWSVLASLFSRWDTAVGSGVGLVLQLFSCLTGDESAMELWLLLSSSEDRETESLLLFWLEFWIPFLCMTPCENTD